MTAARNMDRDAALAMLRQMERIRAFEEQAILAAERKLVLGAIHPSIGQEGVAVGVAGALRRDDMLLSTHRGHGHTLAKGADARAMMRELLGRAGGCCGGKGGSMHIADFSVGMLGANGVVAANIVIAAGAAHAIKMQGGDRIVCCIFGDGAVNRGTFLEGLNWARVFDLPLLFVCEDNRYSASTLTRDMTGGEGPAARAASLGLPVTQVDGNDALATREAAETAIAQVRAGSGPAFLHCRTYRQHGHTSTDVAAYRPEGEAERMMRDTDPIARLREALVLGKTGATAIAAVRSEAQVEMQAALAEAEAAPWPDDASVFADVQDVGSPALEPY